MSKHHEADITRRINQIDVPRGVLMMGARAVVQLLVEVLAHQVDAENRHRGSEPRKPADRL